MPRRRAPRPLENHHPSLPGCVTTASFLAPHDPRRPDERREAFLAYVEQALAPELRPRDIVIMDNLPAHKVHGVRQRFIEAVPAQACATCRPTVPTSIPSKWPSPSSRPCCAPPPREPSLTSGKPLPTLCAASPRKNAQTISPPPATMQHERNML